MKVLIVNTYNQLGGAARAAYRLHESLLSLNVQSHMLVMRKEGNDPSVIPFLSDRKLLFIKILTMLKRKLLRLPATKSFSANGFLSRSVLRKIKEVNPDIIHLHWISDGFLDLRILPLIEKPIVWSLHDMYPFTGGCHYDEFCDLYKESCQSCLVLNKNKRIGHKHWRQKHNIYSRGRKMHIVGLSQWLKECAEQSSLFSSMHIVNLPNPIDSSQFSTMDKTDAKYQLNLPTDKRFILFGAMVATSDPRKGFKELSEALKLTNISNTEIVVFGSDEPVSVAPDFNYKTRYLGTVNNDAQLKLLYNAADVVIVPSIQENLSNAILESLCCGTPVVAFNIGGNGDMVTHKANGYLAKPYDPEELAEGVKWIFSLEKEEYLKLSSCARKTVVETFESAVVGKKYEELYSTILQIN